MLVSTRYKTPYVASGLQARRGFEGAYFASGRPTRRRGRAGARDGGLDDWCQIANIFNKVQGWIFCCLIPCMFPNMRVQKIWQNRFFVLHTCISNSIWTFEFLTRRNSGVLSLAGHSIYRKCKTNQEHVNDPANNDDKVNQSKLDILKESRKQMI